MTIISGIKSLKLISVITDNLKYNFNINFKQNI